MIKSEIKDASFELSHLANKIAYAIEGEKYKKYPAIQKKLKLFSLYMFRFGVFVEKGGECN